MILFPRGSKIFLCHAFHFSLMFLSYFFSLLSIAGLAVLWRTWLEDHPALISRLQTHPRLHLLLTCGVCTSYWLSFIFILVEHTWLDLPIFMTVHARAVLLFFTYWMALGLGAVFTRNTALLVQELLSAAIKKRKQSSL